MSKKGCRITILSTNHLKRKCLGSWFGTPFFISKPKWKNLWDYFTFTTTSFLFSGLPCRAYPQDTQMTLRLLLVVLIFIYLHQVLGHGRLMEPVSRASAWRKGFKNPADYNDNEGYCGGYSVSHCSFCLSHLICCLRSVNFESN